MNYNFINVLLIEDNPADVVLIREMLKEVLNPRFNLYSTQYLDEGLEYLEKSEVDVLLLDLNLPDSHGLDTFLKAKDKAPMIPIVILSAFGDEYIAIEAVKCKAQDYLIKGKVDSGLLARSISYAIERKSIEEELIKHRDHLEDLVEERTKELQAANEQLQKEIEEHKKTEESFKESEEKFRELFNNANDMISLNEIEKNGMPGKFIEVNDVGAERLGYKRDEFLNMTPYDIVAPENMLIYLKMLQNLQKMAMLNLK